jgi:hypothetical protein
MFQCPAAANCSTSGSALWDAVAGTLSMTVRFGAVLDSSNETVISFRMLNPSISPVSAASSVGVRALFLTSSSWTKISSLSGSVLGCGDSPRFISASVYESR